ncbi:glycosyltransferase family 2 protein [Sediminibacterium ginsengisoli]|uniref:glycosyltransferase family 2 protein n=1 Tax=Sediminibacterium ginsengisoli TaxID=413434 RepID=UPI001C375A05|nr:glycosyltransferase family 2 protein [Sediminibacterium ginsengisoli]
MKITIITATWNSAATLEDTLRSVKEQSYADIEHIIIDGASTDDTLKIADRFPHIAKICSEKDNGIYDAMNKGIALATGDIIGILNSDDVLADNRVIERIAARFEDAGIDAVYGDLVFVDRNDLSRIKRVWKAGSYRYGQLYRGWMPPHPTVYVRRGCYERFGLFNIDYKVAADYDMLIRLLLINRIALAYIPAVLIRMRTGGVSTGSFSRRFSINKEDRLVWENNKISPRWYTLYCKPLYKVKQFLFPALQWRWLSYRRRNRG